MCRTIGGNAMEMQLLRENMETEQVISAKPTQAVVEAEVALPGGLREEARVYFADASVSVNGGEISGSRVTAEGRVTFHVLYAQGDLAKVAAMETATDFTQALPLKEENPQLPALRIHPRAEVQHVSAKAFNGRLLLRAILLLTAEASLPRTLSFIRDVAGDMQLQRDTQVLSMQRAVGEGESQTLLREEFELSDVLQIKDTLYATAQAQLEDISGGADGRATVTGVLTLDAYHTADMPGRPLVYTRHSMPFEQTVGLSGALGDALSARTWVKDVAVLSQDGENGSKIMRAEVQLVTEITAVADESMTVLRDLFTTQGEAIETRSQHVIFRKGTVNEQTAESGKTVLVLPEGSPRVKTPLLAFARPIIVKAEKQNGKLALEGILETTLVYRTDDSEVPVSIDQEEPFRAVFSTDAEPEDGLMLTASQAEASAVTGDRVEMKYILHLQADGVRKGEAEVITDALKAEAPAEEKGIALYFPQEGETLWEIAKRYRVPMEEIKAMNPAFSEGDLPGTPVITYRK